MPTTSDDASARERALDVTRSFLVQAPAGSGKTELLVRRFLALLANCTNPEAVCAMTFTRKAAGEMRARVLGALADAEVAKPISADYEAGRRDLALQVLETDRKQGWDLLSNPARLRIYTIDGLSSRLASSMPVLARTGSGSPVDDARALYRAAVRAALAVTDDLLPSVTTLLARQEMRSGPLEEQLTEMLGRREQWTAAALTANSDSAERLVAEIEDGFRVAMDDEIAELAGLFPRDLLEEMVAVAGLTGEALAGADAACPWPLLAAAGASGTTADVRDVTGGDVPGSADPASADPASEVLGRDVSGSDVLGRDDASAPAWHQAAALLLTKAGTIRKRVTKNEGAEAKSAIKDRYLELLATFASADSAQNGALIAGLAATKTLPLDYKFEEEGREALLAFFRVLLRAHAELLRVFHAQGSVDFSHISLRSLEALGAVDEPSVLLERIDHRLEHLLVDEFQDTNRMQCELIGRLTSGWQRGDGRTVFFVGDPMQSIYRFRKAEVGLFLAARSARGLFPHLPTEALALAVNYRSASGVIDWVNEIFSGLMGERDDAEQGCVRYAPCVARASAPAGDPVSLLNWVGDDAGQARDREAEGLARKIAQELVPAATERGGQVAVLVRSRKHAAGLIAALRRGGVRFRAAGLDRLSDRPVISDLQALTRALLHPGDRLASLAVLAGPWVGLEYVDLAALVEPVEAARREARDQRVEGGAPPAVRSLPGVWSRLRDDDALAGLSEDGGRRARRARDILVAARAELGQRPLTNTIRAAWIALGGLAAGDSLERLDAEEYFALIGELSRAGSLDLDELGRRLQELDAALDPHPDVPVEIMTMHKAKGLEFDTVVLPRLDATTRNSSPGLAIETDPASGYLRLVAPAAARGLSADDDTKFKFLVSREQRRGAAELKRLFYVAATRAEHTLVLSAARTVDEDGEIRGAAKGSLLAGLDDDPGATEFERPDVDGLDQEASGEAGPDSAPHGRRIRADYEAVLARIPIDLKSGTGTEFGINSGTGTQAETAQGDLFLGRSAVQDPPHDAGTEPGADAALERGQDSAGDGGEDGAEDWAQDWAEPNAGAFARAVGTAVHSLLEHIAVRGPAKWSAEMFEARSGLIRRAFRGEALGEDEYEAATEKVKALVLAVLADPVGCKILEPGPQNRSEWPLTEWDGVRLIEKRIDRTYIENGVRWIVDFKTGGPSDRTAQGEVVDAEKLRALEDAWVETQMKVHAEQLRSYRDLVAELEPDAPYEIKTALYFVGLAAGPRFQPVVA